MIVTVTLNLAVDVTYQLDRVRRGQTSQVQTVTRRAGGKGVNVARTLHALGHEVVVSGLAGGATGTEARAELAAAGLADATVSIAGSTRTTLIVVEADGTATGLSEPGPQITGTEWNQLVGRVQALVVGAEALVLAGSLPPGLPVTSYAQLIALARAHGVPVLLDTHGEPLSHGAAARPAIVKVNAAELDRSGARSRPGRRRARAAERRARGGGDHDGGGGVAGRQRRRCLAGAGSPSGPRQPDRRRRCGLSSIDPRPAAGQRLAGAVGRRRRAGGRRGVRPAGGLL